MMPFLFHPARVAAARILVLALGFILVRGTPILANPSESNRGALLVCATVPSDSTAAASIRNDNTVSCRLPEGESTFLITLPNAATLDRLRFVNENASAEGQFQIAVSNDQLPADSARWTTVEGAVGFSRKRLFNLSLVGIEARYVKLTFQVERRVRIAAAEPLR